MFAGRQLEDDASLSAAGVTDESTLYILMRLLGGAKKRKKKTYTKPKKQKHKHKKIKLAVLKFYKVSFVCVSVQDASTVPYDAALQQVACSVLWIASKACCSNRELCAQAAF